MLSVSKLLAFSLAGLAVAGCTATTSAVPYTPPIVAGAVDNVGITAGVGAQNQGANLTVGYKGAKFAVVPVANSRGERLTLYNGDRQHEKTFSVFALLGVDAKGGLAPDVDIRQVVAVGPAAELWATGASGVTPADLKAAMDAGAVQR